MIIGIGSDLSDIRRVAETLERFGDRFTHRIFTEIERTRSERKPDRASSYAKRFAAKEAFGKALGTGVRAPATLPAIAVGHDALGKPVFSYSDELAALLREKRLTAHLSISDERNYAIAFVILEQA